MVSAYPAYHGSLVRVRCADREVGGYLRSATGVEGARDRLPDQQRGIEVHTPHVMRDLGLTPWTRTMTTTVERGRNDRSHATLAAKNVRRLRVVDVRSRPCREPRDGRVNVGWFDHRPRRPSRHLALLTTVLLLALLPGGGNFVGGLVAEAVPTSARWLNRALHAAAGVVIAVVAVEIMPDALDVLPGWSIGTAFAAGGLVYLGFDWLIERFTAEGGGRMWLIYLAVATDLFGDGLLIGSGVSVSAGLGVALALGQTLADAPEGFAAVLTFRDNDVPRRWRLLLSASFFLPVLAGAALSFFVLRDRPETWQYAALVGAAGLLTVAALEDMIQEAHEADPDARWSTVALIAGFVIFVFVSAGLGG